MRTHGSVLLNINGKIDASVNVCDRHPNKDKHQAIK